MNIVAAAVEPASCPPPRPSGRWDALRRRWVQRCLSGFFRSVDNRLCEPRGLPAQGIHSVLVCRPNHRLGNGVLIGPLIAEIEKLYPGAEIDIVTGGGAAQSLFSAYFNVREVICLPRKIARHLPLTLQLLSRVRQKSYDLAIDACVGSQSGRLMLSAMNARYKVGIPPFGGAKSSAWAGLAWPAHLAHRSVFLLRTAYAGQCDRPYPPLDLRTTSLEKRQGRRALEGILADHGTRRVRTIIGVFANATGAKRYGEAWWEDYLDALMALRPDILFVDILADHGQSQLGARFPAFYSRDIRKMASVFSQLDGFISADCGVMHLAAASGTPTYGLFSVTDPVKYAPYGRFNDSVWTGGKTPAESAAATALLIDRASPVKLAADSADQAAERNR
jgi:heptosyltransferase-3